MTLTDLTLSNTRRFYSSMGNPLAVKGLSVNFVLRTELSEILWSFQNGICAHACRRAAAASKAKLIIGR